ncbi:hypothetical protein TX60_14675 [Listeria monocytogenes]|uniref:hypothetical protein n=1 Tax=Listeria monocytogenes TaxID=1639 RepID=UPI001079F846|nr:hypothetical protein [Listeria monocytogenes]EAA0329186.1 hypothetical protein [Listeria monocytogenes]EAC2933461.1 hypothetical protein [Listeria monocytogenes]EAC4093199.1 hypothetical protein [Listeria monocytogenes]EAC5914140.1 hypothetical protein [Listeria monocytogenes]EAD1768320.1 hypothetical protein [Listeria monocytogenes]
MGENTNKRKDFWVRVLFLIIIFAPMSVLIKYNYSWQIVLIGLVASLSFSFICGINKFQIFKVGKDGIEIMKAVEEAKDVLEDSLLLNLFNANKIGIHEEKIIESIEEAKKYEFIIKNNNITDTGVIEQLEKFKVSILLKIIENVKQNMEEIRIYATDMQLGMDYINQLEESLNYKYFISIKDLYDLTSKFNECIKEDEGANSINTKKFHDLVEENVKHYVTNYDFLANK